MRWIRRRRGASGDVGASKVPEAPRRPVGAWRESDPAMRVSADQPTAGSAGFVRALPTRWRQAPILGPLGHDVRPDGPSGLMPDVARTVDPVHGERPEFVWPSVRERRAAGARRARAAAGSSVAAVSRSVWPTPLRRAPVVADGVEGPVARPRVSVVEGGGAAQAAPISPEIEPAGVAEPMQEPEFEDSAEADATTADDAASAAVVADAVEPQADVDLPTPVGVPPVLPSPVSSVSATPGIRFTPAIEADVPALPTADPSPVSVPEVRVRQRQTNARRTRLGPPIAPPIEPAPETDTATETPAELVSPDISHAVSAPETEVSEQVMSEQPSLVPQLFRAMTMRSPASTTDELEAVPEDSEPPSELPPSAPTRPTEPDFDRSDPPSPTMPTARPPQVPVVREVIAPDVASERRVELPSDDSVLEPEHDAPPVLDSTTPTAIRPADIAPIVSRRRLFAPIQSISVATQSSPTPPNQLDQSNPASPVNQGNTFTRVLAPQTPPAPPTTTPNLTVATAPQQALVTATTRFVPPDETSVPQQTPSNPSAPSAAPQPASLSAPTPPTSATSDPFALDQLAADLYDRLRSRLVDELYVGRERAQLLTDL